mgnify:CR=1 FL=1
MNAAYFSVFSGVVVVPPILGFLADHGGWGVAWLFAAAITLIAGGGMYLGARGGGLGRAAPLAHRALLVVRVEVGDVNAGESATNGKPLALETAWSSGDFFDSTCAGALSGGGDFG